MRTGSSDRNARKGRSVLRSLLPVFLLLALSTSLAAQEICDNGVDDDGNGLIDLNDTVGCPCTVLPPPGNLITNGSFEDHTCCPANPIGGGSDSDNIECATGWTDYQVSATSDFYDPCGFFPSVIPQPIPDGNAVGGIVVHTWPGGASYEYLTQCLATPMVAGQTYQLGFNVAAVRLQFGFIGTVPINFGPLELAIFGLDSCPPLPYVMYDPVWGSYMPAQYCPTELGLTQLGTVTYTPTNNWESVNFTFQAPFDVGVVMIGPACPIPQDYNMWGSSEPYFFFDDISLEPIVLEIITTGDLCTDDLVLSAEPYDASAAQYQWYLDGVALVGQTAQQLAVSDQGLPEGIYQLRAWNANNCVVAADTVDVAWPEPAFTAAPVAGCAPLEVVFTNTTTTTIASVAWDLGDGSTATTTDVTHVYTDPGAYDVRLSITSPEGCVKDTLMPDLVQVSAVPTASFVADTVQGCPGLVVQFTNTSLLADGAACSWDMGDGTVLTECDPTYTYTAPGTYDVQLTVTTPQNCPDDTLTTALISILPVPAPAFSIDPAGGCIPLVVRFDNETPGASSQTAAWNLGNGQTSDQTHTIGTYTGSGVYTVSLTMTNSLGCSATLTYPDTITAHPLPEVLFTTGPDSGCAPLTVTFQNTTDPTMSASCAWNFGDGSTSTTCNAVHTYTQPGVYNVSLAVTTPASCTGDTTLYELITVHPSPTAAFDMDPQPTDLFDTELTFTDRSSPDVIWWNWSFTSGVPGTSTAPDPVVMFPFGEVNDYPAVLVVGNELGCTDTAIAVVRISGLFSLHVPNAFTPDGDGINDLFLPVMRDAMTEGYQFLIFDRWGEEVFTTTNPANGWDGTVDGAAPKTDVYVWRILVRSDVDGVKREFRGHITVLP